MRLKKLLSNMDKGSMQYLVGGGSFQPTLCQKLYPDSWGEGGHYGHQFAERAYQLVGPQSL